MTKHAFNTAYASAYGVISALLIDRFIYLVEHSRAQERYQHDGRTWIFASTTGLSKSYPYLSPRQIKYALGKLVDAGILRKANLNEEFGWSKWVRTTWYAFENETSFLDKMSDEPAQEWPEDTEQNGLSEDKSVTDVTLDNFVPSNGQFCPIDQTISSDGSDNFVPSVVVLSINSSIEAKEKDARKIAPPKDKDEKKGTKGVKENAPFTPLTDSLFEPEGIAAPPADELEVRAAARRAETRSPAAPKKDAPPADELWPDEMPGTVAEALQNIESMRAEMTLREMSPGKQKNKIAEYCVYLVLAQTGWTETKPYKRISLLSKIMGNFQEHAPSPMVDLLETIYNKLEQAAGDPFVYLLRISQQEACGTGGGLKYDWANRFVVRMDGTRHQVFVPGARGKGGEPPPYTKEHEAYLNSREYCIKILVDSKMHIPEGLPAEDRRFVPRDRWYQSWIEEEVHHENA